MAQCDTAQATAAAGFRLWPVISAAALRRKLLEAITCGVSRHGPRPRPSPRSKPTEPNRTLSRSDRLAELLRAEASESGSDDADAEAKRKVEALERLQSVVKNLRGDDCAGGDRRREAATEVRQLTRDDSEARETLAMLGAIPPLVGMLDSADLDSQIAALYALLNLGIGNDANKAAIVKAGMLHKMLTLIESQSSSMVSEAIVANFLSLSALDSNKPIIGSSGAIPFLISSFRSPDTKSKPIPKQDALRALYNLSICPGNIPALVDAGFVPCLLASIGDMGVSERALASLSNVVAAPEGRRAVSRVADAFAILVDVLHWNDAPACQEAATYVLMVMAHKAYGDRAAMVEAGVVASLLELTLLGSTLAQKRASRILDILSTNKGKQVSEGFAKLGSAVSAPLGTEEVVSEDGMSEERRAVRTLVQQSLASNMRRIVRRANLPMEMAPAEQMRALAGSSTSKSLPF